MEIFSRKKYFSLTLVLVIFIAGYALMTGPKEIPGEFNTAIFSFRRITLAPVLILGAFASLVFIIFKKP
ncbi:MAG: DUF3098 domain-containing protein [Draconibacterium sp.]